MSDRVPARVRGIVIGAVSVLAAAWALAGCASPWPSKSSSDRSQIHTVAEGPCIPSALRRSAVPEWARPSGMPANSLYILGKGDHLVAYVFDGAFRASPERAGTPRNKVLWMPDVRDASDGFAVSGRSPSGQDLVVSLSASTNGGAVPSALEFSEPGCWELTARWGARRATLAVQVQP